MSPKTASALKVTGSRIGVGGSGGAYEPAPSPGCGWSWLTKLSLRPFQVVVALLAVAAAQVRRSDGSLAGISVGESTSAPSSGRLLGLGSGGGVVLRACCTKRILISTVTPLPSALRVSS